VTSVCAMFGLLNFPLPESKWYIFIRLDEWLNKIVKFNMFPRKSRLRESIALYPLQSPKSVHMMFYYRYKLGLSLVTITILLVELSRKQRRHIDQTAWVRIDNRLQGCNNRRIRTRRSNAEGAPVSTDPLQSIQCISN